MIALCVPVVLLILFKIWVYNKSLKEYRLRWARFCFAVSVGADCLILAGSFYVVYYVAIITLLFNLVIFRGVYSLTKEAMTANDKITPASQSDADFRKIENALEVWVAKKSFREQNVNRDEIAEELHITKEELSLYFATKEGVDFRTWRTMLRVEDAKAMLLEDKDAPINIIAEVCGFSDRSNFHRQFVKIVGCSPKEWRESCGKVH